MGVREIFDQIKIVKIYKKYAFKFLILIRTMSVQ